MTGGAIVFLLDWLIDWLIKDRKFSSTYYSSTDTLQFTFFVVVIVVVVVVVVV